jgi:5'(3')-deoxyribonucleotidase
MKTLLIDMDGMFCDYIGRMLRLAYERYGFLLYDSSVILLFNMEIVFGEAWAERVEELSTERGFFAELAPYPYAISALQEMRSLRDEYGVEVVICSAPKRVYKNPFVYKKKQNGCSVI